MICGVDEAGRGALVGPLVIAFVCFEKKGLEEISLLVRKDSKQLSPSQRESLFLEIEKKAKHIEIEKILPSRIDKENINTMENGIISDFVSKAKPDHMFVDLFEHDGTRMVNELKEKGAKQVTAEHKADENYCVVACASIIAKVTRDNEIKKLHNELGFFGSGYPADERTIEFVKANYEKIEPYVRKKWSTLAHLGLAKDKKIMQGKL
ncbi:MAG: ribonuclease HII [Candidatus Micrarchaeota archaeon]|nr:ribonuclease HII [Candidatus Micrarchaeota archaeon]